MSTLSTSQFSPASNRFKVTWLPDCSADVVEYLRGFLDASPVFRPVVPGVSWVCGSLSIAVPDSSNIAARGKRAALFSLLSLVHDYRVAGYSAADAGKDFNSRAFL